MKGCSILLLPCFCPKGDPLITENNAREDQCEVPAQQLSFLPGMLGQACPWQSTGWQSSPLLNGCILVSLCLWNRKQLVFNDQEENMFGQQGPCYPVPPSHSLWREMSEPGLTNQPGCLRPSQQQMLGLRTLLLVIWHGLDNRCPVFVFQNQKASSYSSEKPSESSLAP